MSAPKIGPALSPVDYDAWNRGYMPPSEHILIDALAYRGAKVVSSMQGGNVGFWIVTRGKELTSRDRRAIRELMAQLDQFEIEDEEAARVAATPPSARRPAFLAPPPPAGEVG